MSHQDLSSECLSDLGISLKELHHRWCAVCVMVKCVHAGSDQWHQRMMRQTDRAEGPDLTQTDLKRFPGLAQFETVGERTIIQVPRAYETSPVIMSPHNTPNPGKVLLPGAPSDRAPAHFQRTVKPEGERRVKPGATIQLDE